MEEFNPTYEEVVAIIGQKDPKLLEWAIMASRSAKMEAWIHQYHHKDEDASSEEEHTEADDDG